ncbi:hypothetical protein ACEPPN_013219 [Leptodophora sp. 'Broadleaf-Isolate-01']
MFHRIQKFIQKKLDEKRYKPLSKSDCEDQIPEHSVNEKDPPQYWNWELDWHNISNSSIWSNSTGFGGDGDRSLPITVGEGRCVTDGPFKDLRPIMYNHTFTQHCLSRGFRDGDMVGKLPREPFGPESIGGMMRNETYKGFIRRVEFLLHNRMHSAIGGDFLALTAANGM